MALGGKINYFFYPLGGFLNRADVAEIIQKAAKIVAENEKSTTAATLSKPQ